MAREFKAVDAIRQNVPLLLGLTAPSGGGKTWSALLLAMGIQQECGGDIYFIDSDNNRALHYAGMKTGTGAEIKFKHIPFSAPHDSLAYRDALNYCEKQKAGVIIVDTLSKEHDGEGGMLEAHDTELDRMAGNDYRKRESMSMLAWAKPKAHRRKLIQAIQELETHALFTFRAKQGVKPVKVNGKTEVVQQGFTPIAGDEFVFEMTLNALLLPHSGGVATWESEFVGERMMIKLPEQFAALRTRTSPLDEKLGRHLALWSKGGVQKADNSAPEADKSKSKEDKKPDPQPATAEPVARSPTPETAPASDGMASQTTSTGSQNEVSTDRPTTTEPAQTAAGDQASSDSATSASTNSPAATSSQEPPDGQSSDGEKAQPDLLATQSGGTGADDSFPGDREPTDGNRPATEPGDQPATERQSAPSSGFVDYAAAVADARDWPAIDLAKADLRKTEEWKAATYDMQEAAHRIAYVRLKELVDAGYRFDFLMDLQVYRSYAAWESDLEALKGNRAAVANTPAWKAASTPVKIALDTVYDKRVAAIKAMGEFE